MPVELLFFESPSSVVEDERYKAEPGYFESMRSRAAVAMAQSTLRDAAIYQKIIPKRGDSDFGKGIVRHRWSVGIERHMDEVALLQKQLDQAKHEGMMMAFRIVQERVAAYSDRRVEGPCKYVIRAALESAASAIAKAAIASGK